MNHVSAIERASVDERRVLVRAIASTALRAALKIETTELASQSDHLPASPLQAVGELELAGGHPKGEKRIRAGSAAEGVGAPSAAV